MSTETPNFWRPLHAIRFEDLDDLRTNATSESIRLDFKNWKFLKDSEKARKHLCAMANGGQSGGRFVFGAVTDAADRVIEKFDGLQAKELRQEVSRLRNAVFEIDPPVRMDFQHVPVPTGGEVIVVEVRATEDGPHQVDGCYYTRKADGIGRMTHSMVLAAAQRAVGGGNRATFPLDIFSKDHFGPGRAVELAVLLSPYYATPPIVPPWDIEARALIDRLLKSVGAAPQFPTPDGVVFYRNPTGLGAMRFDGVVWEVRRFIEGEGPEVRRQLWIAEIRSEVERMLRDLAQVLAGIQPSLEVAPRARIWTLPVADGIIELLPEDPKGPVDHYEGFRQHQLPVDGLILGDLVTTADLAASEELRLRLAERFCAQLPLYCHTVRRV